MNKYCWQEKPVDQNQEHIKLFYKDSNVCVALVSPPIKYVFGVEFLVEKGSNNSNQIINTLKKEIDFYLVEKREPNPWEYAKYHCSTSSNLYSEIHWSFHPENRETMTFYNIVKLYGIDIDTIRLVRHGNAEIPILETFRNNRERFDTYQSMQAPNKFSDAKRIAVFSPYRNTLALFLGIWDITGYIENINLPKSVHSLIDKHSFPQNWHKEVCWYNLNYNSILDELTGRLVVDWGKSTLSWVQTKDKPVIEIKGKNSIGDFKSYDQINLSYPELRRIINYQSSNITWVTALSNINGIYLIREKVSGKLYVGSAYGGKGIFGRWQSYANSGHGGNIELMDLEPNNFEISILEILPSTFSAEEVIEKENRWKKKLGARQNGLNRN